MGEGFTTGGDSDSTSFHVRRAQGLERNSIAWLIARFSPFLLVQANYRLRGNLRRLYDPEDLVNEVWVVALSRLGDLKEREGRLGAVFLRFLGATLLNKANQLITRALSGPRFQGEPSAHSTSGPGLQRMPAPLLDASSIAARDEAMQAMREALAELAPSDQEVLVLRGIEQLPNEAVAKLLGMTPGGVTRRYQRALARLRQRLPGSLLEVLPED